MAGDLPVEAAHAVPVAAQLESQHGHVERRVGGARGAAQAEKLLAGDAEQVAKGVKYFSIRWKGKASWPAGTGVWVVKTVVDRTASSASWNDNPASRCSRSRSRVRKVACPSLACQMVG